MSDAAFARYLNLTAGFVSQLERGTKQPKGPALALLNVIRRKVLKPTSRRMQVLIVHPVIWSCIGGVEGHATMTVSQR
jgi:hypothetical protein